MAMLECGTAKTSNEEGKRFVTVSQIGMSGVPQVRVGVVDRAMRLVDNHTHSRIIVDVTVKIAFGFASCNFLTVTGTINLILHLNVCDYLYKNCSLLHTYIC